MSFGDRRIDRAYDDYVTRSPYESIYEDDEDDEDDEGEND